MLGLMYILTFPTGLLLLLLLLLLLGDLLIGHVGLATDLQDQYSNASVTLSKYAVPGVIFIVTLSLSCLESSVILLLLLFFLANPNCESLHPLSLRTSSNFCCSSTFLYNPNRRLRCISNLAAPGEPSMAITKDFLGIATVDVNRFNSWIKSSNEYSIRSSSRFSPSN